MHATIVSLDTFNVKGDFMQAFMTPYTLQSKVSLLSNKQTIESQIEILQFEKFDMILTSMNVQL